MVEEYNVEDSYRILKALSKILSESSEFVSEQEVLDYKENFIILDSTNIIGVIPKTIRAKLLCRKFLSKNYKLNKVPDLKYTDVVNSNSAFPIEYLDLAFNFFKTINTLKGNGANESTLVMMVGNNYPLSMSNNDWEILVAPIYSE
ncbi:hypothetical protein JW865_04645 [Candidatus Bathyarchaeota archaeon]|nr:hypothetical protein [Candidatus Bathyarchaeota archaeon]